MIPLVLILFSANWAFAQRLPEPIAELLWPDGAPGALGTEDTDKPSITIYQPAARRTATAVVVCPGGGYRNLAMDHEGQQVARWLNSLGVTALVLKIPPGAALPASRTARRRAAGDSDRAVPCR